MLNTRRILTTVALAAGLSSTADAANLIFSDEFNSGPLDPKKWTIVDAYGAYNYEGELACYMSSALSFRSDKAGRSYIYLTAKKRDQGFRKCSPSTHPWDLKYSSGRITTASTSDQQRFAFQYGYAEARMKLPPGQGLWPAFWMMPVNTNDATEIDVVEWIGRDPRTAHVFAHAGTRHTYCKIDIGRLNADQRKIKPNYRDQTDWTQSFHTFGVNIRPPGLLDYYIDGHLYCSGGTTSAPFNIPPMFMMINLAIGGAWGGNPDATTKFPASLRVDYVRVYDSLPTGLPPRP